MQQAEKGLHENRKNLQLTGLFNPNRWHMSPGWSQDILKR